MKKEEYQPTETNEVIKAAFEKGVSLGHRWGVDRERAWHSGSAITGANRMEYEHTWEKAKEGMNDEEKSAFEQGFKKGEQEGTDEERRWQSAQKDKRY